MLVFFIYNPGERLLLQLQCGTNCTLDGPVLSNFKALLKTDLFSLAIHIGCWFYVQTFYLVWTVYLLIMFYWVLSLVFFFQSFFFHCVFLICLFHCTALWKAFCLFTIVLYK